MSQWRGRLEDNPELESAVDWTSRNWHVPVVGLLLAFMLWNRVRSWQNFVVDGEVLFRGNDPWYHYRSVSYTVQNWPATMPFDAWTYFPYGTSSGQFGTLFDQLIATAALVIGLGSPSDHTVRMTLLFAPAVFGVAAGVPTYVIGRRLGGRVGGVTAVAVLALSVGSFLSRSMVGFSDHHVAEALFMTVGVLASMVAVTVADREKPIYEQVAERDFDSLRPTLVWSALAGFAVTLYLWAWPFGVLLIGLLGTFYLLQLTVEFARGQSPEHTAFAGAVSMGVAGVLLLSSLDTVAITANQFSLLQPLLAFAVAAGCVFLAWLAREWERRDLGRSLYPATVFGIIVAGVVFVAVALPDLYGYFANQLTRIFGLGFFTGGVASTVGEAQPLVEWSQPNQGLGTGIDYLYQRYGFALMAAFVGLLAILGRFAWRDDARAEHLLVVVWAVFMVLLTFTQRRFMYYLVFPVAVLTGHVVSMVFDSVVGDLTLDDVADFDVDVYQVIVVLATVLVLFGPLVAGPTNAVAVGDQNGPGQAIQAWDDGLEWMQENTPEEGTYGGADNEMDHYDTYAATDDFDYDEGAYGVLSWWDYGHWITASGERIPNANPFQQGGDTAAEFLIAQDEDDANQVLDDTDEDDAKTRYVAVDWKMVTTYGGSQFQGKFFAPPNFVDGVSTSDFYNPVYYDDGQAYYMHHSQEYYNSTAVRLYKFHGSAVEPDPYVIDWTIRETPAGGAARFEPDDGQTFQQFDGVEDAREYTANDSTSSVGGVAGKPSQRVPAMENYRLVGASERSATDSQSYNVGLLYTAWGALPDGTVGQVQNSNDCNSDVTVSTGDAYLCLSEGASEFMHPTEPRWTKFFERVPGATIEGTGPPDSTVQAAVEMQMPDSDETFTYTQRAETDENGEFTMTVPYSTTGYDEYGPDEGRTNVSVRANGSYEFSGAHQGEDGAVYQWYGTADVSEGQVVGEDDSSVTVEMEDSVLFDPSEQNQSDDGNGTDGNATTGNETQGQEPVDVGGDEAGNESASDLAGDDGASADAAERVARPAAPRR